VVVMALRLRSGANERQHRRDDEDSMAQCCRV